MEFRVLGALEAGPGGAAVDLGPPKQRALLAILLLHVGEIVPIDRIVELLWGDEPPRTAGHSIQIYISELRKVLEPLAGQGLIVRRQPGYQLDTPPDSIDARHFESLIRDASTALEAGERDAAIRMLRAALELWRGPALSDFAYEEFAQPYIRRFHDLHLDAIEALTAAELDAGQAGSVVPLLEAAIREDPLRERSRELLMLALYRTGRHAEALRTYERLRELLVEELGLEPSPPLQQLRDRVLLHDPMLLPVTAATAPTRGVERNPYKGLQPFGEADADDYFGRDALVERLLGSIADGQRLVALVGPSGSGKSSVIAAGLIPRLRRGALPGSDRWIIVTGQLGPDPTTELQAVLGRIGVKLSSQQEGTRVVLVLDHFEQLFGVTDEARRDQFLSMLATILGDESARPIVILGLRADYYDRPLQHPAFSEVFVPGVIHVLPMSPRELEAAIVEPAERVGVAIDTKLLAELVADSVARPGSLPLLQYALTELFEQRAGSTLTTASYAALGGLRGVLSRRAEATFLGLSPDEQRVAIQLFLRLVRLGRGTADSRRRLLLSELTGLGIDTVALSAVLLAFSRHRLLTFDRDEVTGEASVELAHEALLTEWERFAGWIDRHRAALRRRDALLSAVDEWELSGRDREYLLTGSRLSEFEAWRVEGSLQLSRNELEFLDASAGRREAEQQAETARVTEHGRLARSARRRLIGLTAAGLAAVLLGGATLYRVVTTPPTPLRPVVFAWDSGGLVDVQALTGFDRATTEFGLVGRKYLFSDLWAKLDAELGQGWADNLSSGEVGAQLERMGIQELRRLSEEGNGLIFVGPPLGNFDLDQVAAAYPNVHYASGTVSQSHAANVAWLTSVDAEPSYLAGAAAALTSTTGTIGYIGGVDWEGIWAFQAGYEAGARAVRPDIRIFSKYLTAGDNFGGFNDPDAADRAATNMYEHGADVIFHASGSSGLGLFSAALTYSRATGRQVWAIGVDTDQYETVMQLAGATEASSWQAHILTSVLKGIDGEMYELLKEYAHGQFRAGSWNWGLAEGTSGLSYSGGFIDALRPRLDDLKARIISGEIKVPCIPTDHLAAAAELGLGADYCRGVAAGSPLP